jgi:L-histidine N-alpha-methyltransferase
MIHSSTILHPQDIAQTVKEGFEKNPKALPSWLFYDETGDKIFQSIMQMPEYYPTRCEYQILQRYKGDLLKYFNSYDQPFHLIELGAGDGHKTELLLKHFIEQQARFKYYPVDISESVLHQLNDRLNATLPQLDIHLQHKEYYQALEDLDIHHAKKVILFMGANIGNFSIQEAREFLKRLTNTMKPRDLLMIGFDLKKDPRVIVNAYDDAKGITHDFNLNLLTRLNKELGADFQHDGFEHFPFYDPENGTVKSFLISLHDQNVYIEALSKSYHFRAWETIHTEVSQKYDLLMIEHLLSFAGLDFVDFFYDSNQYYCDILAARTSN